ncbi:IgGFc-binding protein-like, partial [Athene cunicularia]|uniref:IgGFc-binding protein-like n=1 Tax=Athene cunicularia TaxID=194338 RepID=UPI000EF6EA30
MKREGLKEFAVVAGKSPTTVSIEVKGRFYYRGKRYVSGSTLQVFLEPYRTFQVQSSVDLSGTKITSDNAVALFSGHTCAKVHTGCDYVVEQLLPVAQWGKSYLIPPNPLQRDTSFAYALADAQTSITYNAGGSAATEEIAGGEVHIFAVKQNSFLYVSASAPIQVVYFFAGAKQSSVNRDPFLVNIPPISTYCTSYRVSGIYGFETHVILVAPKADASATTLNQKEKAISWQTIPGTDFSWARIALKKSAEIQSVEHRQAPLGLLVFGFQNYAGYGFAGLCATPASAQLPCEDPDCNECSALQSSCVPETFTTCWATGDPHYLTFDGKTFDFMGTCTYTLTKTCDSDPKLPVFSVEAKNEHRANPKVSCVGSVTVRIYDIVITMVRAEKGIVRVNNHHSHLPIALAEGKLHLQQKGKSLLLETDFKLKILYDWDNRVLVKLPSALSGKVCGLCGNSNGNPHDDSLMPDGNLALDAVELGRSWKVAGESRNCRDTCDGACGQCRWEEAAKYKADTSCGMLTQRRGPFESCHAAVNPNIYLRHCVNDVCMSNGLHAMLCKALEAYADDCQEEGVTIPNWRALARCHRQIFIYRAGLEASVETDFGLTVTYDWQSQVTVSAPGTYANALCGLCGNYNGDAGDEMTMRNGRVTSDPDAFGHSWKVTDVPGCVERSQVECPAPEAALQQQRVSKKACGIMLEEDGPFGSCHAHVDPAKYFQSCVHEFCLFPDQEGAICPVIARYTSACQAAGVTVERWRTNDFCSISCPANSHYELCSQSCSQICGSIHAPVKCSGRCREGCVCDEGFVLSGDQCVPVSQCGCLDRGFYYKVEETFYPTKQEQCQCRSGGAVACRNFSCPEGSQGKIVDGVFQCQPATLGACLATGDRSYLSFDGMAFNIPGACSYILTETCGGDDVVKPFVVKIKKEARQKRKVSGIEELSVEVYGLALTLTRGKRGDVTVGSISHHLPAILSKGQVQVHQHGTGVLLQTDFGLVVRYDLLHHVMVTVPQSYRGHLCGLCGNYNGERDDDLLLPSG